MKALSLISLFLFSTSLLAITPQEAWKNANKRNKVMLLNEYRAFYEALDAKNNQSLSEFHTSSYYQFFINDAYAASPEGMNCVYAGWPSKRVNNLCSSPQRQNPAYEKGNCSSSEMQCQPLLFGQGICVPVSTSSQRSLAFSNCSKKFESSKRSTEDVVDEIQKNKKEKELFEYMDFAAEICSTGKQASTAMCRRLEGAVQKMRSAAERLKEAEEKPEEGIPSPTDAGEAVKTDIKPPKPEIIIEGKKVEEPTKEDLKIIETVTSVTEIKVPSLTADEVCIEPELPKVEIGKAYDRDSPRYSQVEYISSKSVSGQLWDNTFTKYKDSSEEIYSGFDFMNSGPNSIAAGEPLLDSERVERQWRFTTEDGAKQESYIWITDDAGSGKLSELMETIMIVFPRNVQPKAEMVGDDMVVTLATGETVVFDKNTKTIKAGAMKEGKVDLTPNRFNRKFAAVDYTGSGISIRVDKRGEDPRLIAGSAVISQNGSTCKVPANQLWSSKSDFKYGNDAELLSFINSKCGNKFKI